MSKKSSIVVGWSSFNRRKDSPSRKGSAQMLIFLFQATPANHRRRRHHHRGDHRPRRRRHNSTARLRRGLLLLRPLRHRGRLRAQRRLLLQGLRAGLLLPAGLRRDPPGRDAGPGARVRQDAGEVRVATGGRRQAAEQKEVSFRDDYYPYLRSFIIHLLRT